MLQLSDFFQTSGNKPLWWPSKLAVASLDYTLDTTNSVIVGSDVIASVSVQIAPSGVGELSVSNIFVNGYMLTVTTAGGQPNRVYTMLIVAFMTNGRNYAFLVNQGISQLLDTDVPQISPTPGFGTAIMWNATPITAPGLAVTLPSNAVLRGIAVQNATTNILTGGLNIGITPNGSEIASAVPIGSLALVPISSFLRSWFSTASPQPIYFSSGSSWNNVALNVRVFYDV